VVSLIWFILHSLEKPFKQQELAMLKSQRACKRFADDWINTTYWLIFIGQLFTVVFSLVIIDNPETDAATVCAAINIVIGCATVGLLCVTQFVLICCPGCTEKTSEECWTCCKPSCCTCSPPCRTPSCCSTGVASENRA
jgi:hypothetical protein